MNPYDDCLTPEEEARMELEYHLNATRWPIEDEGYLEALDAVSREGSDYQMEASS